MATIYTQAQLDALDSAIAARRLDALTFADQTFTFTSVDDLLKLRAFVAGQLSETVKPASRYRVAATKKGV